MLPWFALALAVAAPPAAGPAAGETVVAARASARVLPSVIVRQGRVPHASGPHMQIRRAADGTVLVEFT